MSKVDRIAELEAEVVRLREDRGHDEGTIWDLNHTVYAQTLMIENLQAENIRLSKQLEMCKEELKFMADFSSHCCEDCLCDEFRIRSEDCLTALSKG